MKYFVTCLLAMCITKTLSVTLLTAAMQRKYQFESCIFKWSVDGDFTNYDILKTGGTTALGTNTNHSIDSGTRVVTLMIWNIQLSDAGSYTLSISTGPTTTVSSSAVLFVYYNLYATVILAVGRNPAFEGDTIELNCSANSNSAPADFRPKINYFWNSGMYGNFRNISSGNAVLQNGIVVPGYSIKNDGKTFVIASAQYGYNNYFTCFYQEEGSPNRYGSSFSMQVYSRPYTYGFYPGNKICNAALYSAVSSCYFYFVTNSPLTSYTNWTFTDGSGYTSELPLTLPLTTSGFVNLNFVLSSSNSYGNYSVTLTNSNGSTTETLQVLPPGPPDIPSNFSLQYATHSIVSLQWLGMGSNAADGYQTVFIRLTDIMSNAEVETQIMTTVINPYNKPYATLFQNDIQPETGYEASIWSVNTFGSSDVVKLPFRTPKRLILMVSPANISIKGSQATISFTITDSSDDAMGFRVACCVESTNQCINQSYTIANTDNRVVFNALPTGNEYVCDFNVYESDGYTYTYDLAIVKGVRISRMSANSTTSSDTKKEHRMEIAVIVLAALLGLAVFGLIGCLIAFLVCNGRKKSQLKNQSQHRSNANVYVEDSTYETPSNSSVDDRYYTSLDTLHQNHRR